MGLGKCIGIKILIIRENGFKEYNMESVKFGIKANWSKKDISKMGKLKLPSKAIKK